MFNRITNRNNIDMTDLEIPNQVYNEKPKQFN